MPGSRQSAKVVVLDADGRILILRRSAACRVNAGRWEFPGGKIEPGEGAASTALREVEEECGLTVTEPRVIGELDWDADGDPLHYIFLETRAAGGIVQVSPEHDIAEWVEPARLASYDLCPQFAGLARSLALQA